jgi:DNA-binding NarL/FixJ family response regulator
MRRALVAIADPLPLFRAGVRNLLRRESDLEVLEAATLDELLAIGRAAQPSIALIDLDLPPCGGIEAIAALGEECAARPIVWSLSPTPETVLAAVQAGAVGYLDKRVSSDGLLRSLRGLANGEAPISRSLTRMMIDALHGVEERDRVQERAALLSLREREVLELVALGSRNREIAQRLLISEFTVKRHVQNILEKLELPSRHAAAAFHQRLQAVAS